MYGCVDSLTSERKSVCKGHQHDTEMWFQTSRKAFGQSLGLQDLVVTVFVAMTKYLTALERWCCIGSWFGRAWQTEWF